MKRIIGIVLAVFFTIALVYLNFEDTGEREQQRLKLETEKLDTNIANIGDSFNRQVTGFGEKIGLEGIDLNEFDLSGSTVGLIIPPVDFRDEEYRILYDILTEVKAEVIIISTRRGECVGMLGRERCTATMVIEDLNEEDFTAIVILGGIGTKNHLWHDQNLNNFIFKFGTGSRPFGGIQLAPYIIADSGAGHGKHATVYKAYDTLFKLHQGGMFYLDRELVIDDNLITANGPGAAEKFAKNLVILINEYNTLKSQQNKSRMEKHEEIR